MTTLNTSSDERGAAFSRDGQHLYFSSNREGGAGGYDIYVARKDGKSWTTIERLGDSINSAKNETGPAPSTDDRKLYFSTDRVTDRDIYVAQRELPEASEEAVATGIEPVAIAASSEGWSLPLSGRSVSPGRPSSASLHQRRTRTRCAPSKAQKRSPYRRAARSQPSA